MARPFVKLSDSFSILRDKVNTVSYNVGDPDNLNTYLDSDVVQAINEIENVFDASSGEILYPTGVAGETQTRLLISTAQSSGTDVQINVGANFNVDAVGDINLDAGGSNINFLDDSVTRFSYTLGSTNTLDVTGIYDLNVSDAIDIDVTNAITITSGDSATIEAAGFLVDVTGNIVLDADGGDITFKDGGNVEYNFATNGTVSRTGDLTFDITGDIVLDADGDNITFKNGSGGTRYAYTLGASNTLAVTGNLTETVSGNYSDSANGTYHIGATDAFDITVQDTLATTSLSQTHTVTGSHATDTTTSISRTAGTSISDSADTTYHIGATGNTDITTRGDFTTNAVQATHNTDGNFVIDAGGDITLDADGAQIYFKDNNVNKLTYNFGTDQEIDVVGSLTYDVQGDIVLDAGGADIYFKDDGVTRIQHTIGDTNTVAVTGNYVLNARDDITLDAGGNNIYLKDSGSTRVSYTLGTANTIAVTGSLAETVSSTYTMDVSGDHTDSADGIRTINATDGLTFETTHGPLAITASGNGTVSVGGNYLVDAEGDITLDANGADVVLKDAGVTKIQFNLDSDQTIEATNSLILDADHDITLEANGKDINFNDGTQNNFVFNLGSDQEIDVVGTLTFDVASDIILDAAGADVDMQVDGVSRVKHTLGGTNTVTVSGNYVLNARDDITLDAGGNNIYLKDSGSTRVSYTLGTTNTIATTGNLTETVSGNYSDSVDGTYSVTSSDPMTHTTLGTLTTNSLAQNHNVTGDYTVDASGDIILDANGLDIKFKNGSYGTTVTHSISTGADYTITGMDNFTVATSNTGDIIFQTGGKDILLRTPTGGQFGRFQSVDNRLNIYSGSTLALEMDSANFNVKNLALFTDSALGTDAQNVAGGINELETVLRGTNGVYTLETTAQNIRDAINELSRELYDSGSSFTGLSANNFTSGIEELRTELGDHTTLTTSTTTSAVAAINELDAEVGDSDISSIYTINNTVKGALRQLHTEVGSLSLTVKDSEGGVTTTVTDLTTAANVLDSRLDIIEDWTNQDVKTSASPTFNQVTTSEVNYSSAFTLDIEGDINLDANGGDIFLKDNGTQFGRFQNSSNQLDIYSGTTLAVAMDASKVEIHGRAFFVDSALDTSVQNVAGAINELHTDIVNNDSDIAELDSRVGKLYNLDSGTAGGFFSTASINNDSIVNALNELASRAVLIYDENGTLLN